MVKLQLNLTHTDDTRRLGNLHTRDHHLTCNDTQISTSSIEGLRTVDLIERIYEKIRN